MIVMADAPGIPESYPVTVLSWLNGRVLSQDYRFPHHFEQLGQLTAKLHNHSQYWTLPPEFDRPTYCADEVLRRVYCEQLPSNVRDDLLLLRERLLAIEEQLGYEPEQFGLAHFDLSFGNVLFTRKEAIPIDFEECGFVYYLFDLAVILAGPWQRPEFQERFKSLIQGYREIRKLDDDLLRLLPTFMAARAALLGQWQRVQMLLNLSYPAL
jgi:Ser/Thr protein kinase RdoA (MazF antagonist)